MPDLPVNIRATSFKLRLYFARSLNTNDIAPLIDPDDVKKFSISIARLFPAPLPTLRHLLAN